MWGEFHLLRPWWLLALLPLLIVAWRLRRGARSRNPWGAVVDPHLLLHLRHPLVTATRVVPRLLLIGWLVAVVALAAPTWSRVPPLIFRPAVPPLVIVLELSVAMDATDLKPSRLAVARLKLQELLERLPPRPVGLVVFAGSAHGVLPLTEDRRLVSATLNVLESDLMPLQGRAAAAALLKGYALTRQAGNRECELLLVASGVEAAAVDTALRLGDSGATVSVLAMGTEGEAYTGVATEFGSASLQRLAAAGGGRFVSAAHDDSDVEMILAGLVRPVRVEGAGEAGEGEIWQDRGGELVLLLLPLALLAFRRGWLAMVVLTLGLHGQDATALEWAELWLTPDQRGVKALQEGDAGQAARLFQDPLWRGVAHYRNGEYKEALAEFAASDLPLAHYNRGNTLIRLGRSEEALAAYDRAIELDPDHADARFNRERLMAALLRREQHAAQLPQPERQDHDELQKVDESEPLKPYVEERLEALDPDHLARPDLRDLEQQHGVDATLGGAAMLLQAPKGVEGRLGASRGPESEARPEGTEMDHDATEGTSGAAEGDESGLEQSEADAPAQESGTAPVLDEHGQEESNLSSRTIPVGEAGEPPLMTDGRGSGAMMSESELALEQWLNRIPDEPGGYLKEKFAREYQRQHRDRGGL
jgi:Ca-activated chloride channel family protein